MFQSANRINKSVRKSFRRGPAVAHPHNKGDPESSIMSGWNTKRHLHLIRNAIFDSPTRGIDPAPSAIPPGFPSAPVT